MGHSKTKTLVIASAIMLLASGVNAATKGRIIPNGTVSFQKNGTVANYNGQTALDENALITCHDNCIVKLQGLSLAVADQTKFAVKQSNDSMNLYVEDGRINFTLTNTSQQMTFYIPSGQYVKTEGFIVPASTAGTVKGYVNITEKTAELGMDTGSMVVQTSEGIKTIRPGEAMQIALADVPEKKIKKSAEEKEEKKKGAVWWSSLSSGQQTGLIAGSVIVAGVTTAIIIDNSNDDDNAASPNQ